MCPAEDSKTGKRSFLCGSYVVVTWASKGNPRL